VPINPGAVGTVSEAVEHRWSSRDALLYALSVGAGASDPTGSELEFTTDNTAGVTQRILPTFPVVVPTGRVVHHAGRFDPAMLVHGEEAVELHEPLPVEGHVASTTTLTGIYDKGSGAVITSETTAVAVASGRPLFTTRASAFVRGEGGFGGDRGPSDRAAVPDRAPDHEVAYGTRPDQALLYRLNGDRNPLHSDPAFAARAGFPRPILHGLCTFGFTGRALLHALCGSDPSRFVSMAARFSRPVFPGDALTVAIWDEGSGRALFRTTTPAGTVVDGGRFVYR